VKRNKTVVGRNACAIIFISTTYLRIFNVHGVLRTPLCMQLSEEATRLARAQVFAEFHQKVSKDEERARTAEERVKALEEEAAALREEKTALMALAANWNPNEANLEGYNTYEYANGSRYDGEWRAGLKHGSGSMLLANGDLYTGEWQAGEYCGCGRYVHHNGTVFEGIFQANKKTGHGRCYYNQNGSFASEASSYSWNAGDVFDGEFLNNMRHGSCTYTWVTGDTLSCEWVYGSCPAWEAKNNEIVEKMKFQQQHQCDVQMTTAHTNLVQERNAEQQLSVDPLELDVAQLAASVPNDNAAMSSKNKAEPIDSTDFRIFHQVFALDFLDLTGVKVLLEGCF